MASVGVAAWQAVAYANTLSRSDAPMPDALMLFSRELPAEYLTARQNALLYDLYDRLQLGSEEDIAAGGSVREIDLCYNIYAFYFDLYYDDTYSDSPAAQEAQRTVYPADEGTEGALSDQQIDDLVSLALSARIVMDSGDAANFRSWLQSNRGVYTVFRRQLIADQLNSFREIDWPPDQLDGCDYYAYSAETNTTLTNLDTVTAAAAQQKLNGDAYALISWVRTDGAIECTSGTVALPQTIFSDDRIPAASGDVVRIGLRAETYDSLAAQWVSGSRLLQRAAGVIGGAALVCLLSLIVLCFGAGHRAGANGVSLTGFDSIWSEVQLAAGVGACFAWCYGASFLLYSYNRLPAQAVYAAAIGMSVLTAAVLLIVLLAQVRRIKVRRWLEGFLLFRLLRKYVVHGVAAGVRWVARQFGKSPLRRRLILLAALLPLLCAFWFTIPFVIAGLLYFGLREADSFEMVAGGARDIRAGKSGTRIELKHGSQELCALADDLNGIADGLSAAVDTAVKSERLKAELISNVSHDIKTPLTSIITYLDLLKQCDLPDGAAREYVDILDQKAQRLRILTGDLFDASKASSGAMTVELMQTDFDALLQQALGERSEQLEQAGLDVRIDSRPPVYVKADGRLLWRILDNLLSNCARYALHGSRVYLAIRAGSEFATLTVKNISAFELNISADELMERFTRGDRARHTEGSGLGLSIAKSLAELMGGACRVEIDGDLFKAMVTIPVWTEDASASDAN